VIASVNITPCPVVVTAPATHSAWGWCINNTVLLGPYFCRETCVADAGVGCDDKANTAGMRHTFSAQLAVNHVVMVQPCLSTASLGCAVHRWLQQRAPVFTKLPTRTTASLHNCVCPASHRPQEHLAEWHLQLLLLLSVSVPEWPVVFAKCPAYCTPTCSVALWQHGIV
jgi:hypothetical protein